MPRLKTDAIDKRIGQNIRYHRMRRGMTLAALGEGVGVVRANPKYEIGSSPIAASRLARIAEILQVQTNTFFQELTGA